MSVLSHQSYQHCKHVLREVTLLRGQGLKKLDFKKLLLNPEASLKGHMNQERANLQYTKTKQSKISDDENNEHILPTKLNEKPNELYCNIIM